LPKINQKNVKLAGKTHAVNDIPFDTRGFPIFDKHVIYDTRIPSEVYSIKNSELHMRAATRDLRDKIQMGKINKNIFTEEQLRDIFAGDKKIYGYTWHHHQDTGRMQLITEEAHNTTGHVGGMDLWFKK
jgi:hypothetical protein